MAAGVLPAIELMMATAVEDMKSDPGHLCSWQLRRRRVTYGMENIPRFTPAHEEPVA